MKRFLIFIPVVSILLFSCTTKINIDLPSGDEKLVVEGHIEQGKAPFILLTKSTAYFAPTSILDITNSFIHNALIKVFNGTDTFVLVEKHISSLPDSERIALADMYQIQTSSLDSGVDVTFYTSDAFKGETGKSYWLSIQANGQKVTSVTTIPQYIVPDSFYLMPPKNDPGDDTLMRVFVSFKDPLNEENYYRIYTKRNRAPFYSGSNSTFSDAMYNGEVIKWYVVHPNSVGDSSDISTHGMFWKGDTVVVKFCTIDAAQFNFWKTFDQANRSGGPFANPVQIKSNINGGLGIWGGFGAYYQTIFIPKGK